MRRAVSGGKTGNGMKAAFLAVAVLAAAGVVFYFGTTVHAARASGPASAKRRSAEQGSAAHKALPSKSLSLGKPAARRRPGPCPGIAIGPRWEYAMSGNPYLFAAYAVTWIIHIAYLGTTVRRYARLQREIEELKKAGGRS